MTILNALTELYTKVVGSAPAPAGSIGDMVHQMAEKWPEAGASVTIDASLTKTGQAADAKATGDALNGKAPATHTHTASQITDLPAAPGNDGQGRACQAGGGRGGCRRGCPHEGRI